MARTSEYPMIPMDDAWDLIHARLAGRALRGENLPLSNGSIIGRILKNDVVSPKDIPNKDCSRLDGYAVRAAEIIENEEYPVALECRAGHSTGGLTLPRGAVALITTGAPLPDGADSVIPVEYCRSGPVSTGHMAFAAVVKAGNGVRCAGSDLQRGDVIASAGSKVDAALVATLLSAGITEVSVVASPRVGVMSSGDELVSPWEATTAAAPEVVVIDSNKTMLAHMIQGINGTYVDCSHTGDDEATVIDSITRHVNSVDVLITTGGVSMGDRDYIKPALAKLGKIHFGRLLMKPGKPAVFAEVPRADGGSCLVFALPGNPVSAFVCFHMLVHPAIRFLMGFSWQSSMHPKVPVKFMSQAPPDPERPEFHRAVMWFDDGFRAQSTGSQASSRLASTVQANALVWIPARDTPAPTPLDTVAYMIGALQTTAPTPLSASMLPATAGCSCGSHSVTQAHAPASSVHAMSASIHPSLQHEKDSPPLKPRVRVAVLTVSTSCFAGKQEDKSGPAIPAVLRGILTKFDVDVVGTGVVADRMEDIQASIDAWCHPADTTATPVPHLMITTGGTGFTATDVTPEALRSRIWKPCPGLVHAMLQYSLSKTPMASLSRYEAGILKTSAASGGTLLLELPGSVKAVQECLEALATVLPHALGLLQRDT